MRTRLIKSILFLLIGCLWLITAFLIAEFSLQIYQKYVSRTNPIILSLNNQPPWTHSGVGKEEINHTHTLPPPDRTEWYSNRAEFFFQLDEHDRNMFASFYHLSIYIKQNSKTSIYLPDSTAPNFFTDEFISNLMNEISTSPHLELTKKYYPSITIEGEEVNNCFIYLSKSHDGFLVWYQNILQNNTQNKREESNIWEIPYFEYRPHARLSSYEFHTNNFGFRDEDIQIPKPKNVFRIVCLGGSTTEEGPTEEETYPNIVEKLLAEQYNGPYKVEVINAGIPGISANKLWLRLPDFLFMQPDLIIYCEGANDITHILLPYWIKNLPKLKKIAIHSALFRSCSPLYFLPDCEKIKSDIQKDVLSYIEKIHNYLIARNIHFAIMSMPAPNYALMTRQEKDYFQYVTRKWWGGDFIDYRMYSYVLDIYNNSLKEQFSDKTDLYIPMYEMFQEVPPAYFNDLCHQKLIGIQKKAALATSYLLKYLQNLNTETTP